MVCLPLEFFIEVRMKCCYSRPQLVLQTGHTSPNPFCSSGSSIASIPGLPRFFVLRFAFSINTRKWKSFQVSVLFWTQTKTQKWSRPGNEARSLTRRSPHPLFLYILQEMMFIAIICCDTACICTWGMVHIPRYPVRHVQWSVGSMYWGFCTTF